MTFHVSTRYRSSIKRDRSIVNWLSLVCFTASVAFLAIPNHRVTGLTLLLTTAVALWAGERSRRIASQVESGFHDISFLENAVQIRQGIVIPTASIREVKIWDLLGRIPTLARVRCGPPLPWYHRRITIDLRCYDNREELIQALKSVRPPSQRNTIA